jgi:flagellar biosynthetic protein FliQ
VTSDQALDLFTGFVTATLYLVGPVLAVAAIAGTLIGIVQTATQINEPSIGYAVKVAALIGLMLVVGPTLAEKMISYTRVTFERVGHVVQ